MVNIVSFEHSPMMKQLANYLLKEIPAITTIVNTVNTKIAQIARGEESIVISVMDLLLKK